MLERVAAFVEPTLDVTPPDLLRPGPRGLLQLLGLGRSFARLGDGASEAVELLTGPGADRSSTAGSSPTELKATLATDADHRRDGEPVHAGHRLRALPPRHGRDRRPARRVGLRARRHGRAHPGPGARRARPGRRDPLRGDGGPHPGARRPGDRRGPRERRGVPRPDRGQQRRRQRDLPAPARPRHAAVRASSTRCRASPTRAPRSRSTWRSASCRTSPRVPAPRPGPSTAAPSTSAPISTTSSARTTTPSTAAPRSGRSSSARSPRWWMRPWRRPAATSCPSSCSTRPTRSGGRRWDQIGEAFADRCFALLDEYAPNFSRSVLARQVLTPLDIERMFGLTGGNIFQGAMTPGQLFSLRPVPGLRGLPHAGDGSLPVRGGRAPGRRGDGLARVERGARDPAPAAAHLHHLKTDSTLWKSSVQVPTRGLRIEGRRRPPRVRRELAEVFRPPGQDHPLASTPAAHLAGVVVLEESPRSRGPPPGWRPPARAAGSGWRCAAR